MTRGRRVQTSTLRYSPEWFGAPAHFYGTVTLPVPDFATQQLVVRKFDLQSFPEYQFGAISVTSERSPDATW